jgi:hypothetical protein
MSHPLPSFVLDVAPQRTCTSTTGQQITETELQVLLSRAQEDHMRGCEIPNDRYLDLTDKLRRLNPEHPFLFKVRQFLSTAEPHASTEASSIAIDQQNASFSSNDKSENSHPPLTQDRAEVTTSMDNEAQSEESMLEWFRPHGIGKEEPYSWVQALREPDGTWRAPEPTEVTEERAELEYLLDMVEEHNKERIEQKRRS